MRTSLGILLLTLFFFTHEDANAQTVSLISSSPKSSEQLAIDKYHKVMGEEAHLFSGSEFVTLSVSSKEHQYFEFNQLQESKLVFDGLEYQQILILYDIVNDDIIAGRYNERGSINYLKVDKHKVFRFYLPGHTFLHISGFNNLAPGFYEQLYKGNLQVLAKRKKIYKKEVVTVTFPVENNYFILKNGIFHPVKSKGSMLNLLKDHKKELLRFLKSNNIIFSQNREFAITKLAEQYDLLTQAK